MSPRNVSSQLWVFLKYINVTIVYTNICMYIYSLRNVHISVQMCKLNTKYQEKNGKRESCCKGTVSKDFKPLLLSSMETIWAPDSCS
jgi:hypothetical protein